MSPPRSHHKYELGEVALSCDVLTSHSKDSEAELTAYTLKRGDGAFILRHDRTWRYAIVAEVSLSPAPDPHIIFVVKPNGCTKRVDLSHWGDRVRPLKPKPMLLKVVNHFASGHKAYPRHTFQYPVKHTHPPAA